MCVNSSTQTCWSAFGRIAVVGSLRMGIRRNRDDKPLYWECMLMISSAFCLVHQGLSCLSSDWTSPNCDSFNPLSWRSIEDLAESWTLPPKVPWWKTWVSWLVEPGWWLEAVFSHHMDCLLALPRNGFQEINSKRKTFGGLSCWAPKRVWNHTWGDSHDNYASVFPLRSRTKMCYS